MQDIINILKECGALLNGNDYLEDQKILFLLSSGRLSQEYVQCAKIQEFPEKLQELSKLLAAKINVKVDYVAGPAIGAIIPTFQLATDLKAKNVFCERNANKIFEFRRGFNIVKGANYIVMEDVVTTGGSAKQVVELIKAQGGNVVLVASYIDRSKENPFSPVPYISLIKLDIQSWEENELPEDLKNLKRIKPGSNFSA